MDSYGAALDSDDLPDRTVSPDDDDQEHEVRFVMGHRSKWRWTMKLEFVRERVASEKTKSVLLVLDGLGGLPRAGIRTTLWLWLPPSKATRSISSPKPFAEQHGTRILRCLP